MTRSVDDQLWISRYPRLFVPHLHSWGGAARDYTLRLTLEPPPDELVVNVRLIATAGARIAVCQTAEGWRTLPGGSRELGETVEETARRELGEEAGVEPIGPFTWFASYTVLNPGRPWRAWHPHPVTAWWVGCVEVAPVGPPTNPADGETVVAVHWLSRSEAHAYLSGFDNDHQAGLLDVAAELGVIA